MTPSEVKMADSPLAMTPGAEEEGGADAEEEAGAGAEEEEEELVKQKVSHDKDALGSLY
jgi:hypothetical protein